MEGKFAPDRDEGESTVLCKWGQRKGDYHENFAWDHHGNKERGEFPGRSRKICMDRILPFKIYCVFPKQQQKQQTSKTHCFWDWDRLRHFSCQVEGLVMLLLFSPLLSGNGESVVEIESISGKNTNYIFWPSKL